MATYEQLIEAARIADQNGEEEDARRLLEFAVAARKSAAPVTQNEDGTYGAPPEGMVVNPMTGQMTSRELLAQNLGDVNVGEAALTGAAQGTTLGTSDELFGAVNAVLPGQGTMGERYAFGREFARAMMDRSRDDRPVVTTGAEIAGAVALPIGAIGSGSSALGTAARGAAVGGGLGFGYGFGAGEGGASERLDSGINAGILSSLLGAAAPGIGGLAARALDSRAVSNARRRLAKIAPDTQGLRAAAGAIFDRADTVGLPSQGLPQLVQDVSGKISRRPINPKITPRAAGVMSDLEDVATTPGQTVTFGELQDIRRTADAALSDMTNPAERRAGAIIQSGIDDFVEQADPSLAPEIAEARKMWGQLRKSETIQDAINKAQNQASGFENGLRVQIRSILNNKKKRRGFSKDEIKAMEGIVQGTTFGNIMKRVGRLSFGMGQQTNVLSGLTGMGIAGSAGSAMLGPAGIALGAVSPAIGYMAKRAGERSTEQGIRALQGLIVSPQGAPVAISPAARSAIGAGAMRGAILPQPLGFPEAASPLQMLTVR